MTYFSSKIELPRTSFSTADQIVRFPIEIPQNRGSHIVGVKIYEVGHKTNEFSIGLQSHKEEIQELTYKEDWTRLTEQTRTKDIEIEDAAGRKVFFDIQCEEPFSGNTALHVVFILSE